MGTTNLDILEVDKIVADEVTIGSVAVPAANLDTLKYLTATYSEINNLCDMSDRIENITSGPYALASASDRGVITVNKADGVAITLAAAAGTGLTLDVIIGTTITSSAVTFTLTGNDVMYGFAILGLDAGDTCSFFATAANTNKLTMNGGSQGGIAGARVRFIDIATDKWAVEYFSDASGSEATPFSNV